MAFEHKSKVLPFAYGSQKGISETTDKRHHDTHYAGYVAKRNEVEQKLATADRTKANANFSDFGELKRKETFNASGQILHELYWDMLGGDGVIDADSAIGKAIIADFGSFENPCLTFCVF